MKDITEGLSRRSISVLFVVSSEEEVLTVVNRRSSKRSVEICCGDGQASTCDVMIFRNSDTLNGNCNFGKSSIWVSHIWTS
jgi:hypothetical protein